MEKRNAATEGIAEHVARATPGPDAESAVEMLQHSVGNQAQLRRQGSPVIVDDQAAGLEPGQMRRGDFLAALERAVAFAVEPALAGVGRTAQDCPYIRYMFDFYGTRGVDPLRRAVSRHAPETRWASSAENSIVQISERARHAAEVWATTGRLVWEGLERSSESDPRAVLAELGPGKALENSVRTRAESVMQEDFSAVRVHTDANAERVAGHFDARAVTVGRDVVFAPGEYRPGTLVGDAIIAHELAHVVQQKEQRGTAADQGATPELERDANQAATGVVMAVWGTAKAGVARAALKVRPAFRTGLRVQCCKGPGLSFVSSGFTFQTSGSLTITNDTSGGAPVLKAQSPSVDSDAWIAVTGGSDAEARDWDAGYIQTVFSMHRVGEYKNAAGVHTKNLDISIPGPRRDGVDGLSTPEPWYNTRDSLKAVRATKSNLHLTFYDRPSQGFPWQTPDGSLDNISGKDEFGTWLVVRQRSTGGPPVYLNWATWEVDWSGTANATAHTGTPGGSSGSKVTDSNEGPGNKTPVLTGAIAKDPSNFTVQFL